MYRLADYENASDARYVAEYLCAKCYNGEITFTKKYYEERADWKEYYLDIMLGKNLFDY